MTDFYRLGIKLFAMDASAMRVKDFVPIFHSWIQRQCIDGHQLIDVHDYSHVHNGPGILLVAHEGNFSTDMADGRFGLAYFRKLPASVSTEDALKTSLKAVREGASLIEAEPNLGGRVRFRTDELLVVSNDRLLAPNNPAAFERLKPTLAKVFGAGATFSPAGAQAKDRLTIHVRL